MSGFVASHAAFAEVLLHGFLRGRLRAGSRVAAPVSRSQNDRVATRCCMHNAEVSNLTNGTKVHVLMLAPQLVYIVIPRVELAAALGGRRRHPAPSRPLVG
jgi:hypothetical protein